MSPADRQTSMTINTAIVMPTARNACRRAAGFGAGRLGASGGAVRGLAHPCPQKRPVFAGALRQLRLLLLLQHERLLRAARLGARASLTLAGAYAARLELFEPLLPTFLVRRSGRLQRGGRPGAAQLGRPDKRERERRRRQSMSGVTSAEVP